MNKAQLNSTSFREVAPSGLSEKSYPVAQMLVYTTSILPILDCLLTTDNY